VKGDAIENVGIRREKVSAVCVCGSRDCVNRDVFSNGNVNYKSTNGACGTIIR
jgi:hypothetical protein